jgi:tetratricopeptide (TPR) repeat protein
MPNTFGQRFRKKKEGKFTGRREQITIFANNLKSEEYLPIFNIHGIGGVGKTTLSKNYKSLADEANCLSAYTNEAITDLLSWMAAVSKQYKEQKAPLKKFDKRYEDYLQANQKLQADPDKPKGTLGGIIEGLSKGAIKEAKKIPGGDMLGSFINEEAISSSLGVWADFVHKKISPKDDVKLVLNTVEVLSPIFWKDILDHAESFSKICLFVDTFERTDSYLDDWLLKSLEGTYGDLLPPNLLLTIAGRKPLKETWSAYKDVIHSIRLERFTEEEAMSFLKKNEITDEALQADIIKLSDRLPVLMDWLVFTSKSGSASLNEACDTAVDRFLKWVDDPAKRDIALDVALCRQFNQDTLTALPIKPIEAKPLFEWLHQQPFVIKYGDHWRYHEVVRAQMLNHFRSRSPENWSYKHNCLAHYYDSLQRELEIPEKEEQGNEQWQSFKYEKLYHSLCAQPYKNLSLLIDEWIGAIFSISYIEILEQVAQDCENKECEEWSLDCYKWFEKWRNLEFESQQPFILKILNQDWEISIKSLFLFHVYNAKSYRLKGKEQLALKWYQKAIDLHLHPDDHEIYYGLGKELDALGYPQKAIQCFQKVINLNPDSHGVYFKMGNIYFNSGNPKKAIECFMKVIESNPDSLGSYINMGNAYIKIREYQSAIQCCQKAIDINPNSYKAYINMGNAYINIGEYQKAIQCCQKAIDINPDSYEAYGILGLVYFNIGEHQKAIQHCQKAIDIKPYSYKAYGILGLVYFNIGEHQKAIQYCQKAIDINPNSYEAYINMGNAYNNMGEYHNGIQYCQKAISINPNSYEAYLTMGGNYINMGEYHNGIQYCQKAIDINPNSYEAYFNMGNAHIKIGEHHNAIHYYQKIIDINPSYYEAYYHIGYAYHVLYPMVFE